MRTSAFFLAFVAFGCGGDDASAFLVRAHVRGMPIQAITALQIRFEAPDEDTFGSTSGSVDGLAYSTEEDGSVFAATGDEGWVNEERQAASNEFLFEIPFQNPADGSAEVNLHAMVLREVDGDLVRIGDSALMPVHLPAEKDAEIELLVGCIEEDLCRATLE